MRRFLRFALRYGVIGVVLGVFYADTVVTDASEALVFERLEDVPSAQAAVVLGTSAYLVTGEPNPYFSNRMDAAAELYKSGKISWVLASGDFQRSSYNEPGAMREALIARGVPSRVIYLDNQGLDTFDSVLRARQLYGLDRFVVVSQRFHIERAVYIGRSFDIDIFGYSARRVAGSVSLRTNVREYFARVKALTDVTLFRRTPRYGAGENRIAP